MRFFKNSLSILLGLNVYSVGAKSVNNAVGLENPISSLANQRQLAYAPGECGCFPKPTDQREPAIQKGYVYRAGTGLLGASYQVSEKSCEEYCNISSVLSVYMSYTPKTMDGGVTCMCYDSQPYGIRTKTEGAMSRPLNRSKAQTLDDTMCLADYPAFNESECRDFCNRVFDGVAIYFFNENFVNSRDYTRLRQTLDDKSSREDYLKNAKNVGVYEEDDEADIRVLDRACFSCRCFWQMPAMKYVTVGGNNFGPAYEGNHVVKSPAPDKNGVFEMRNFGNLELSLNSITELSNETGEEGCFEWCSLNAPNASYFTWVWSNEDGTSNCQCLSNRPIDDGIEGENCISGPLQLLRVFNGSGAGVADFNWSISKFECHKYCMDICVLTEVPSLVFSYSGREKFFDNANCICYWKTPRYGAKLVDDTAMTGIAMADDSSMHKNKILKNKIFSPLVSKIKIFDQEEDSCPGNKEFVSVVIGEPATTYRTLTPKECELACKADLLSITFISFYDPQYKNDNCLCWRKKPSLQPTDNDRVLSLAIEEYNVCFTTNDNLIFTARSLSTDICKEMCKISSAPKIGFYSFCGELTNTPNCRCYTSAPTSKYTIMKLGAQSGPVISCLDQFNKNLKSNSSNKIQSQS